VQPAALIRDLWQARVEWAQPGSSRLSGWALWRVGRLVLTTVIVVTNIAGTGAVLVIAFVVIPVPNVANLGHVRAVNAIAAAAYILIAFPLGAFVGTVRLARLRDWLEDRRPAGPADQQLVLRAPLRLFVVQVALWWVAALLFGVLDAVTPSSHGTQFGLTIALTTALTGLVTAACAYLFTERILRSPAARALDRGMPDRLAVPGVAIRSVLAWALGTGLPVLGLVAIGSEALANLPGSRARLDLVVVVLGGIGLSVGLLAVALAARATADPLEALRRALEQVQRGRMDVHVPVYDGTQIGKLQLGFNQMVAGLAERERLRDAFGTYLDPDVAQHVLREGTSQAGELVEVSVMFIDVRNFTVFAERTPAPDVVSTLNRLFEAIVPIIHDHGGRVDKFIGDGLMAVFGAPRRLPDHADQALAAALDITGAIESGQAGALAIGIGINSGPVVSGNVGGAGRLEFSVIGDPVNVAARVEAATRQTGDAILVAQPTRDLLTPGRFDLVERDRIPLKGKSEAVRLYTPRSGGAAAAG
jgi:adenylate cyclase